jgi:uncharacterized protein (TIGR03437 family)
VAPYRVICVVPADVASKQSVTVKVVNGPFTTVPFVLLNLFPTDLEFWTRAFPGLPQGSVDGVIRNADGTLNSAEHPAAPGSTVTLFGTGLAAPGVVELLWDAPPPEQYVPYFGLTAMARRIPGFIDALWGIDFQIPDAPGDGVYVVPTPGVLGRYDIGLQGSGVGVYVK